MDHGTTILPILRPNNRAIDEKVFFFFETIDRNRQRNFDVFRGEEEERNKRCSVETCYGYLINRGKGGWGNNGVTVVIPEKKFFGWSKEGRGKKKQR